ncbi:MAG: nicotinamide mononucleotide transporter [Thermoflavifilum sp.]|nr:nicotinamide mononucleotide transporter [Thermoflavifilum sp.]
MDIQALQIERFLIHIWQQLSWQEWVAVIFAVISVLCARKNSIWVYPTGIVSILFSISLFVEEENKLYPDAALNMYYLVMSIYGWYVWSRKGADQKPQQPISWASGKEYAYAFLLFVLLWAGLYFWLKHYRINNVPGLDSFSSAMAATGMWLLARRKIENWLALLIADAVDIPMFYIKKLYLFCGLNIFYVIIAWLGFLAWKKMYHQQVPVSEFLQHAERT